jgi:glycine/D-amino acid oxidase-like deaminating enzyme
MGVEILTGLRIVNVSLSAHNQVQAVTCIKRGEGEGEAKVVRMGCRQLLLACGPWTPTVYSALFPSSPVTFQNTTDAGDWIVFRNPCPTSRASVAFVSFASIVGDKMEFAGRSDGTIWACGRRNLTAPLPPVGEYQAPDDELVRELSDRARDWLNWACDCDKVDATTSTHDLRILDRGRAFRPATKTGLPTISAVEASRLTDKGVLCGCQVTDSSSGVFLSWGHGSYGLTLGMGSGQLMSQLMHGDKTDIDITPFSLEKPGSRL